jgi:phosphoglycolate phosphatase-like HAD superfamily hydrolase
MSVRVTPVIYVDIDDTLVRSFGSKRMPMTHMVALVRSLRERGAQLFCWSSGGAAYARSAAEELGVSDCFEAFLPKPHLLLDDVQVGSWNLVQLHPSECSSLAADEVLAKLRAEGLGNPQ